MNDNLFEFILDTFVFAGFLICVASSILHSSHLHFFQTWYIQAKCK